MKIFNFGKRIGTKITNGSTKIKKTNETFKEKFTEARKKPVSKRKSLLLGLTTVMGIFSITILAPVLPAIAKDVPAPKPKPTDVC